MPSRAVTQMLIDLKWWDLAQRRTDARLSLMFKIVHNLILIEAMKYVKLQGNLINLQQILADKSIMRCHFPMYSQRLEFPTKKPTYL